VHRSVHVVIPFKLENAKSRLAPVLSHDERRQLALAMLKDVLGAVSGIGPVTILYRPGLDSLDLDLDVDVVESSLELNDALNTLIEDFQRKEWPADLLIVMADLALLTKDDARRIIQVSGDVVLSPGRGGGTNMILIRSPKFRTCYKGISFPKHQEFCGKSGLSTGIYASFRAGCDIDEPVDLAEILIHGQDQTKSLLKSLGFCLSDKGRGECTRGTRPL
jgi:2-phospho-L-lactate guanylyltransferase